MGRQRIRLVIQSVWAFITNANLKGFVTGRIYNGKLKAMCLPGLNCYSCSGSLGACPIGALQAILSSAGHKISLYMLGFFIIIGTVLARFVCGFLCPFGLIQELFNKIPSVKIKTFKGDRRLRYLKYLILVIFVILLPMLISDVVGNGSPWFCKWICPAGTLEGGIPMVALNPTLRQGIGFLFGWKVFILIVTIIASIIIYRPFFKYICPLGAVYALFNKISIYRYHVNKLKCTGCKKCENACPMNIKPQKETNNGECIRCGVCKDVCPHGAVCSGFKLKNWED